MVPCGRNKNDRNGSRTTRLDDFKAESLGSSFSSSMRVLWRGHISTKVIEHFANIVKKRNGRMVEMMFNELVPSDFTCQNAEIRN